MSSSKNSDLIETEEINNEGNEEMDFSSPKDITNSLISALQDYYLKQNLKLFAVNIEYLISNADSLVVRNEKNQFICYGEYTYYSPQNLDYDFTGPKSFVQFKNELESAMISDKNKTLLCYLSKDIITNIPQIAAKSYSLYNPQNLLPVGILNPVFGINLNKETNKLVPLILLHVDEIFEFEDTQFYSKVDTSKQVYTIPIIVN